MTDSGSGGLTLKYEAEYDLLSVWVGAPQVADSVEVEPGLCVRVSRADHKVVGLEVVDAAARFNKDASVVRSQAFAQKLLNDYGRLALVR